jgi:GxxExxY protein
MLLHENITKIILDSFYEVYNTLGYGFLEKVYENALLNELKNRGLRCKSQQIIQVKYKDINVGIYYADIVVEDKVIIEIKSTLLHESFEYQLLNYLKATDVEVGMLLGFGKTPEFLRKIFTNDRKSEHL